MNQRDKSRVRRGVQKRIAADAEGATGELPIVPLLDVITNITLFLLATMTFVMATSEVNASTPSTCAHCQRGPSLNLSVLVTDQAVFAATSTGVLASGCARTNPDGTPTIMRDGHEWEQLTRCLAQVHAAHPDAREVTLSANAGIPYADIIAAMDAASSDGGSPLFPEVRLSAGVR